MNGKDIFDGVTDIRDDLIDGAKEVPKKKKQQTRNRWMGAVAAALVLAILVGIFLRPGGGLSAYAIVQAEYPKMARYPSGAAQLVEPLYERWLKDVNAQGRDLGDTSDLQDFFVQSAQTFLTETTGENRVYSPLNVYMALAMLAQLTDGESREQILTLLGSGSMDELRQRASDVWNCNYRDDGAVTSVLASSLWLDQDVRFDRNTMDILASDFYASSYRGKMGSERLNRALRDWLNAQTGGLLDAQAGNIKLDPQTVLALASTVYFKAKWSDEFSKAKTAPQTFHAPAGDVQIDFMNQRDDQGYYWGNHFAAVSQNFRRGGSMWFLLPDEGVTPEELLSDAQVLNFLLNTVFTYDPIEWENSKRLFVNKAIPKFDVSSQLDLTGGLQALGVTDVFDPEKSDFTPLTDDVDAPIVVGQVNHAARVMIDEEGCTATAFTELPAAGAAAPPDDEVDFVLDRPFLFCITGINSLPLFVGIVNTPVS